MTNTAFNENRALFGIIVTFYRPLRYKSLIYPGHVAASEPHKALPSLMGALRGNVGLSRSDNESYRRRPQVSTHFASGWPIANNTYPDKYRPTNRLLLHLP